ncbi:MAG: hypothetical protein Q8R17_01745 [bacterium]|nr:hypothetical protein [bacterium]
MSASQTKITLGDCFAVEMEDSSIKYFQYLGNDLTQLNSQVIRVFKTPYTGKVNLNQVAKGDVAFYAHTFIKIGLKLRYWKKVGTVSQVEHPQVLFRNTNDYGNPAIKVSEQWHVWKVNDPFSKVGREDLRHLNTEIGVVVSPESIVHRIRTGKYDFVYPEH